MVGPHPVQIARTVLLGVLLALASLAPAATGVKNSVPQLYVLGAVPVPRTDDFAGRVSVVDAVSGQELQAFSAGTDLDLALSPDGARLYVAVDDLPTSAGGAGTDKDFLAAFDRASGRQLWRAEVQTRVKYHDDALSTLVASPDGRYLSIYSIAVTPGTSPRTSDVAWWLQVIDAATGKILPTTIPLPDCDSAAFQLVPGTDTAIAACFELNDLRFLDLAARQVEATISIPGSMTGTALSPDGRWLYAVSTTLQVTVVDVARRAIARQIDLDRPGDRNDPGFVALAADGARLVVGENVQAVAGTDTDVLLQAYDTATWRKVADLDVGRPLAYALAPAPTGHVVYAWGGIARGPPWTPGTIVYAIDLDHQTIRPFLERPDEDVVRIVSAW